MAADNPGDDIHRHLPYNRDLTARAKELRKNMTSAERLLWRECLRLFPYRVLRQRPIGDYIVDFYCATLKLVVEVDGESHFTAEGKAFDAERTRRLESLGLRIVRFTNFEILENIKGVSEFLMGIVREHGDPPNPP